MTSEYKNLNVLLQALSKGVSTLESGKLSLENLDALLQDAREFHERIAILQYLSVQPKHEIKQETPKKKKEMGGLNFSFDFTEEETSSNNQTNLLDAIQDVPAIKKILPDAEDVIRDVKAEQEVVEEVVEKVVERVVEVVEKLEPIVVKIEEDKSQLKVEKTTKPTTVDPSKSGSVNDRFAETAEAETLAEKLGKSPISNLVEEIGFNQKFLFMNDLFEGENNLYKEAINTLNNFPNFIAADEYLNTLKSRHSWDVTHSTTKKFEELVARRYS